jgi:oxygen-independent coproporphyrinogen-3 oxidase
MRLKDQFVSALLREIQTSGNSQLSFDTLHIGGGTPSLLDPAQIGQILETAFKHFRFTSDSEISMEINPGTISSTQLSKYRNTGVNRLSIGVQSFNDSALAFLGRIHSANDARLAVQAAGEAGFENVGIDLIYGIPGQTQHTWLNDLEKAFALKPRHISCYILTYESGTPLDRHRQNNSFSPVTDKVTGDMFQLTQAVLSANGYAQYEISNFAKSFAARSRHNMKYWSLLPYIGLGPGAHSFIQPLRYWNHANVIRYINDINRHKRPVAGKEILTHEQQMIEAVYLGLRITDGLDIKSFNNRFNVDFNQMFEELIGELKESGLIKTTPYKCTLSEKGMLFIDSIANMFTDKL